MASVVLKTRNRDLLLFRKKFCIRKLCGFDKEKTNLKGNNMSNYIKKFLFAALVFMMPYMNSASKAMNAEDYEGSSLRARKISFVAEDQQDSVKQSTSSQIENFDDSQNSWMSYLISPVKATIQITNEFISIATHNPKLAMVVGLGYMISAAEALNTTQNTPVVCEGAKGPCACYTTTSQCLDYCRNQVFGGCAGNTYRNCNLNYKYCPIG